MTHVRDIYRRKIHSNYDYIVIGSGSAGSIMAARLAEDANHRVLLLEAGGMDNSPFLRMPAAFGVPLQNDKFNWYLNSEPEPELNGRRIYMARGRVLGGSSSINGMNWIRGNPWDYDNWAKLGNFGWSYAEVLPYFKRSESLENGGNEYRGSSGPMKVEFSPATGLLYQAFLAAGQEAGLERVADPNAYRQEGVHSTQRNIHGGVRWSVSRAYIHSAPRRENLHVVVRAFATRIEFSGRRAVRIHATINGEAMAIGASGEIILSAGALHSPHLLMHSGIGNADELRGVGIPSVMHLPGVGRGLKDHVAAAVQYAETKDASLAKNLTTLGRARLAIEWLLFKRGLGAGNFFEVGAFIRTRSEVKVPDVQFEFVPLLGEFSTGELRLGKGFQYFFSLMRPTSSGRVWVDSADPRSLPKFSLNYLTTERDRSDAIAAVRAIRHIVSQPAWDKFRGAEVSPGPDIGSDAEILRFLRAHVGTNYHLSCSCRMGSDENAVTDAAGRVHGLDNLRVVDASIMPEIISGNPNAVVIMIAEKVADIVRGKPALPPEPVDYYRAA
jgi:choline dehydrogenase